MDNIQVIDAVTDLRFMPTWEFSTHEIAPDTVGVEVWWETVNSNRDQAVQGYPQKVTLSRRILVHPSEYQNRDELYAGLFTWLVELQVHESREFFRTGTDMEAPFHPHRIEGNVTYDRYIMGLKNPLRGIVSLDI